MVALLEAGEVGVRPMIAGELAVGTLRDRTTVLAALDALPALVEVSSAEAREFVELRALPGRGLSWVDVHLPASVLRTPGASVWTRDDRLRSAADELDRAYVKR